MHRPGLLLPQTRFWLGPAAPPSSPLRTWELLELRYSGCLHECILQAPVRKSVPSLGAGAAWAVHPSHLSHQVQPQLVSWCFHISPQHQPGAWATQSHRAFAGRWSFCPLQPALGFGMGTEGSPIPAVPLPEYPSLLPAPALSPGSPTATDPKGLLWRRLGVAPVAAVPISLVASDPTTWS